MLMCGFIFCKFVKFVKFVKFDFDFIKFDFDFDFIKFIYFLFCVIYCVLYAQIMSVISVAGGQGGAANPTKACPANTYANTFYGTANSNYVTSVGMKCSDGSDLGAVGNAADGQSFTFSSQTGWGSVPVHSGDYLDNLNGYGGPGGIAANLGCPSGQVVNGYNSRSGDWVDNLGVTCGAGPQAATTQVQQTQQQQQPAPVIAPSAVASVSLLSGIPEWVWIVIIIIIVLSAIVILYRYLKKPSDVSGGGESAEDDILVD
jgi:hypothetical protein